MIFLVGFIAFAVLTLVLLYWTYRAGSGLTVENQDVEKLLRPIDLQLVQNLLDPEQERYIRARLTAYQFFRYKLKQFTTANEYISRASHNAAIFVALGRYASQSSDARTASAGQALFEAAVRLRILALMARTNLALKLIFPSSSLGKFMQSYARTREQIAELSTVRSLSTPGGIPSS
jgi:hypothetical protein